MQGSILNMPTTGNQGIILGDDGARYTFTTLGWRDQTVKAVPGMKVDFELRGSHAVGVYPLAPLPGEAAPSYGVPDPMPGTFQPQQGSPSAAPSAFQPPAGQGPGAGSFQPLPQQPSYNPPPASPPVPYNPPPPPAPPPAAPYNQPPPPPPPPVPEQQPVVGQPSQEGVTVNVYGQPEPAAKSGGFDMGKVMAGMAVMFLLTVILSFLPLIGALIGGFVGGRKAGNFVNAAAAAAIAAAAIGGVTFLIVDFIVGIIEGLPIIGSIILATPLGDILTGGAVLLALLNAAPMLIMALIGGATKGD